MSTPSTPRPTSHLKLLARFSSLVWSTIMRTRSSNGIAMHVLFASCRSSTSAISPVDISRSLRWVSSSIIAMLLILVVVRAAHVPFGRGGAGRLPLPPVHGPALVQVRVQHRLEVPVPGRRQTRQLVRARGLKPFVAVPPRQVEHQERRVIRLLLNLALSKMRSTTQFGPILRAQPLIHASSH